MTDNPKVKVIKLEVLENTADIFKEMQKALGHIDKEQTFSKMVELMYAAISLTSKDRPVVRLYTKEKSQLKILTCPHCNKEFTPETDLDGDGFRELAVSLV